MTTNYCLFIHRKDILDAYKSERKKAVEYMVGNKSRVAITTDMWTTETTKKGYMVITTHFIDDSWKLRSVIMRYMNLCCYFVSIACVLINMRCFMNMCCYFVSLMHVLVNIRCCLSIYGVVLWTCADVLLVLCMF